jgi:hypothetical protein
MRDVDRLCVVEDPIHVYKLYARESGDPAIGHEYFSWSALKIHMEYSNDVRLQEVGQIRSTKEVLEQT